MSDRVLPPPRAWSGWKPKRHALKRTCSAIQGTRYYGEHIFVHDFWHTIMGGAIREKDHGESMTGIPV